MENGGARKSKSLIMLERHESVFGFRPTHNPKVAGSNPAPATKDTCRERSSDSDDFFVFMVAPSMAARSPFNSILRPWSGVSTSTRPRSASVASTSLKFSNNKADFTYGR